MKQGAVWLHREIQDHQLWRDRPFAKGQAWIDMILLANHKDNKIIYKNQMVTIKRGEFVRSERFLSGRWGWSKSKVHDFLLLLENDQMITKKSDQKANRISICNYDRFQIIKTKKRPKKDQSPTSSRPVADLNNNDKNVNNDNNKNIYKDFVFLTSKEYENLLKDFGESNLNSMIEKLANYLGADEKRQKKYSSHNHVLRGWVAERLGLIKNGDEGKNIGHDNSFLRGIQELRDKGEIN